jgi:hypothetical protein
MPPNTARLSSDVQAAGRDRIFDDDRLRVAEVIRDCGARDRARAPEDSRVTHGG